MRIKKGVSVLGLKPEILLALQIADEIWNQFLQDLVLTSGTEGKHSKNSRHYVGCAVDLRIRDFTAREKKDVHKSLKDALGAEYYVLLHTSHIHVQYNGRNK